MVLRGLPAVGTQVVSSSQVQQVAQIELACMICYHLLPLHSKHVVLSDALCPPNHSLHVHLCWTCNRRLAGVDNLVHECPGDTLNISAKLMSAT